MTRELQGEELAGLEPRLNASISAEVLRDIESWKSDQELAPLYASLHAHSDERTFLNAWAEALVARRLLAQQCDLRFEVPTPSGKRCDFEVTRGSEKFYLHVKRVSTERPTQRSLSISSRLRILERIERPYIVNIRWHEHLTDEQMMRFVRQSEQFILRARLGDEAVIRDDDAQRTELGGLRILAPWEGKHVSLAIGLPEGFIDESLRMRRLMQRAQVQFMPRADNVILLCSSHDEDALDFETALLGTQIERWDRFPPRGRRIAHGRDADGFWYAGKNEMSRAAGWFRFSLNEPKWRSRLWMRDEELANSPIGMTLVDLFEVSG
jgi:hypothetical protein